VAKPQEKTLEQDYYQALENLKDVGENMFDIISENELDNYAKKVVSYAHS